MLVWDGLGPIQPAGLIAPASALTLTPAGAGAISGDYLAYVRFLDARGNVSNFSPVAGPVTFTNASEVDYTGVPVPTQAKVVRRQILRNTAGQAAIFYVDVDTTDLTTTGFVSTRLDADLATQEPQALFDTTGDPLANAHDPPPTHKSVVAHHLDRMFAAAEIEYREGSVNVTLGSNLVQGIGTEWPETFAGRFLWADGASVPYEIDYIDVVHQVAVLLGVYGDTSNPFTSYAIRPAPAERRLVYYSVAGEPESWPPTQALSLQEDGDDITGLMAKGSFLFILERRHIYRFTFQSDPATDGYVFLSGQRGCVNNRSWATVDDKTYLLDEAGIYSFSGGQDVEDLSGPIQDLFEPEATKALYRVHWPAQAYFHASYHPGQNVIRWFVSLTGGTWPRHALCLELEQKRWWVEEYAVPIAASILGRLNGQPRVFLGGPGGEVYLLGEGTLDRARPGASTLRGTATSAGRISLTDSGAQFKTDVLGCPVMIVEGTGRGQRRIICDLAGIIDVLPPLPITFFCVEVDTLTAKSPSTQTQRILGRGPNGTLTIAYTKFFPNPDSSQSNLWLATSTDAGHTWETNLLASAPNDGYFAEPFIAIGPDNEIAILAVASLDVSYADQVVIVDGAGVVTRITSDSPFDYHTTLGIAYDADGDLHYLWEYITGAGEIHSSDYGLLGTGSQGVLLGDQDGNIHILWIEDTTVPGSTVTLHYITPGGVTETVATATRATGSLGAPTLAVDDVGTVHVFWRDDTAYPTTGTLKYKQRPSGGGWTGLQSLGPAAAAALSANIDRRGYLSINYSDDNLYGANHQYAVPPLTTPVFLVGDTGDAGYPACLWPDLTTEPLQRFGGAPVVESVEGGTYDDTLIFCVVGP